MARSLRLEYPGACYHVINRGNYRRNLFEGEGAAEAFERVLFESCERFGWLLHAYVVMRNHFHLAVETPEPNLSDGMKWLQGTWVARFNRLRGQTGRPFQGRFKALHVQPGPALAEVAHYIHLNPVRARVVGADEIGRFRWSSLHHFRAKARPGFLEPRTILAESGGLADTKAGWNRYLNYLAWKEAQSPKDKQARFKKLSRGWCIGTEEFRKALRKDLRQRHVALDRSRFDGLEREEWQAEKEAAWEDDLRSAAKAFKVSLGALPSKKSDPGKVVLAAWMKRTTGVSNGWLAERLGMGTPASVSQLTRRFRLDGGCEKPTFQAALANFRT